VPVTTDQEQPDEPERRTIIIPDPIAVRDLAAALELTWFKVIEGLMDLDVFATVDTKIDFMTASALCSRHGFVARKVA
jgi:hypothetical protein